MYFNFNLVLASTINISVCLMSVVISRTKPEKVKKKKHKNRKGREKESNKEKTLESLKTVSFLSLFILFSLLIALLTFQIRTTRINASPVVHAFAIRRTIHISFSINAQWEKIRCWIFNRKRNCKIRNRLKLVKINKPFSFLCCSFFLLLST